MVNTKEKEAPGRGDSSREEEIYLQGVGSRQQVLGAGTKSGNEEQKRRAATKSNYEEQLRGCIPSAAA